MKIRVGIEGGRRTVLERARAIGAPLLISANSLWNNRSKKFSGWKIYTTHDVALDSGGFVAMKRYGGYRWSIPQYVQLAGEMKPSWWAQMDFCCEPEISRDRNETWTRINFTVQHLRECQRVADGEGIALPIPVLQGWKPEDYTRGPIYDHDFKWPTLVGVGSVCRRNVFGEDGVMKVVEALNSVLPSFVRLHLFGVKSQAIHELLTEFPNRIASIDSMAWNMQARWDACHAGIPCDGTVRADAMEQWYQKQLTQVKAPKQISLQLRVD